MKKPAKPYWEMNTAELAEATKEFDTPSPPGRWRPMTPAERARWERLVRKPGRPKVGAGAEVVSVSIERTLLKAADRLAKKRKISRAKLIAEDLSSILAQHAKPAPKSKRTAA